MKSINFASIFERSKLVRRIKEINNHKSSSSSSRRRRRKHKMNSQVLLMIGCVCKSVHVQYILQAWNCLAIFYTFNQNRLLYMYLSLSLSSHLSSSLFLWHPGNLPAYLVYPYFCCTFKQLSRVWRKMFLCAIYFIISKVTAAKMIK